jgi:ketosteroid isomerase-like protein
MKERQEAMDQKEIVAHIHGLFQAYINKDRETIRRGHTNDWRGFQTRSTKIVRGIDQYMQAADRVLETMEGIRYELSDVEVQIYRDVAVVYYVASYWVRGKNGNEQLVPLRSVDIYRREAGGWNQCGSNISFVPPPIEG